jgi:30S ribosomal protein S31
MGKGDKKSRRGKLFMGSFGITRPRKKKKTVKVEKVEPAPAPVVKTKPAVKAKPAAKPKTTRKPKAEKAE